MKNIVISFIILISSPAFSQEFNIYELVSSNEKDNSNQKNLAHQICENLKFKITSFNVYHYSVSKIQETQWEINKKKVVYRNFTLSCEFNLSSKLNLLYESNQMRSSGLVKNHLIINSESLSKIEDVERFIVHIVNTDSEYAINEEIKLIKNDLKKTNANVYLFIDRYSLPKPEFKFESDTISTSGLIEIKYSTSSKANKIDWSSNIKVKDNNSNIPTIFVSSNQKVTAYYIDENGCKSNQDELQLIYKESCSCELVLGKPEILYFKSKNIIEAEDVDEAEWEYKFVPEQSGSLNYDIPVKDVCGDEFLLEVKTQTGKVLISEKYDRSDVDARSMNNIVLENKNVLVFNVILDDYRNYIEKADSYFVVTIIPIVNNMECTKRKVDSTKVRFSKCR
jgi:hypothetical protein